MCESGLMLVGVDRLAILVGEMRADVEDDLLDRPGEGERRPICVGRVHGEAVVAADVHSGVAGEAERDGLLDSAAADAPLVYEQRDLAAGRRFGCVSGKLEADVDLAGW